jgi:hypothetical protein
MVVTFLEVRLPELEIRWANLGYSPNYGRIFLALLKFWGQDFDYAKSAISIQPPAILPKNPILPVSIRLQVKKMFFSEPECSRMLSKFVVHLTGLQTSQAHHLQSSISK